MKQFTGGHRFSKSIYLTQEEIVSFASAAGDYNPIHHNEEIAISRNYEGIVASGPHTSALMMGLTATYFSGYSPMVGIEFNFIFKRPILAEQEVEIEWMIVNSLPTRSGEGQLLDLRGRMKDSLGNTVVGSKGKVLLSNKL